MRKIDNERKETMKREITNALILHYLKLPYLLHHRIENQELLRVSKAYLHQDSA